MAYFNNVDQQQLRDSIQKAEENKIKGEAKEFERENFMYEIRDHDNTYKGLLCAGSCMTTKGWKKSGKTRFNSMYISAILHPDGYYYDDTSRLPLIKCNIPSGMNVLQFDTELSRGELQGVAHSIARKAGHSEIPWNYHPVSLKACFNRALRAATMFSMIHQYANSKEGLCAVSFDVGTDFVSGVNDEDQANEFWDELGRLMETYGFCLQHVMHMNKNNTQAAGIFGNMAANKSSMMCDVKSAGGATEIDEVFYKVDVRRTSEAFRQKKFMFDKSTGLPIEIIEGGNNYAGI